jgi:hypothetical protein
MLLLEILAGFVLVAILFLIYCYFGFSRAQHSEGDGKSSTSMHADTASYRHWKR